MKKLEEARLQYVISTSQKYLGELFLSTPVMSVFDGQLGTINQPHKVADRSYQLSFLQSLTGHYECSKDTPFKYTFFVITPTGAMKERINAEARAKQQGVPHKDEALVQMIVDLHPDRLDTKELLSDMTNLLERSIWQGRGYSFAHHVLCTTADLAMVAVFAEAGSMKDLLKRVDMATC
jgi:hypothetical protein